MSGSNPTQSAVAQPASLSARNDTLHAPLLYLSSAEAGWEGLEAQAFHEPPELEGWMTPPMSDISLILFTGGAMRLAQRPTNGAWKARDIRHGDLVLRSGVGVSYEVRWQSLAAAPTQTLHLRLSKDLLTRTAEELGGGDPARVALIESSGFQDPLLTQIGLALWRELEQRSPAGKLYAQTAAQMLAVHLLRHYTALGIAREPAQALTRQQLRRVTEFVQAHLDQDLSLEVLAQQAGFSPYYFARLFRSATSESPHQFVLRQRIERAQALLSQRDLPLVDVALASGFANQSHFTQAFKRQLGQTPHAYRREHAISADF